MIISPWGRYCTVAILLISFVAIRPPQINAQYNRYYPLDKELFNALTETGSFGWGELGHIIIAYGDKAFHSNFKDKSTKVNPLTITFDGDYAISENEDIQFTFECIGKSPKCEGYEFTIGNNSYDLTFNKSEMTMDEGSTFTILPDDTDGQLFHIYKDYKKQSTDYSLSINSNNQFIVSTGASTGVNLYLQDALGFTSAEAIPSDDNTKFSITLDNKGVTTQIKYILNNGQSVTYNELLISDHIVIPEKNKPNNTFDFTIPNYAPYATTLWAIPVIENKGTYVLFGPMYSLKYAEDTTSKPTEPENPENPDSPENPDNTDEPNNPDNPDNPGNTDNPENTDNTDEPNNPDTPDNPKEPIVPENPIDPENPDESEEPSISTSLINTVNNGTQNLPIEYFTIQGIKIDKPTLPGIYIFRQGNQVKKIKIR